MRFAVPSLRESAVKFLIKICFSAKICGYVALENFGPVIVRNGEMFLFVVVSRQTKKPFFLCVLCVSAVKSPNPYQRKSA